MSNFFLLIFLICLFCVPFFIIWAFVNTGRKRPAKKLFKYSGISFALLIVSFIAFGLALDREDNTTDNSVTLPVQNDISKNQELPKNDSDLSQDTSEKGNNANTEKIQDKKPVIIQSGTYNISGESFTFSNSVINDVTGKWRLSLIASSKDITEYAIDYYNTLFSSDDEIHAVVNFTSNTTAKISVLYDGMLDITVYEYVDKEEHDAQLLFSGMLLSEYLLNTETGAVEEIQ